MNNYITSFICAVAAVLLTATSLAEVTSVPAMDFDRGAGTVLEA
ncbi:hypothetical protein [Qipengyuania vesicularis]|nr:hypothetical protein [Qipengyuania vesicularis]